MRILSPKELAVLIDTEGCIYCHPSARGCVVVEVTMSEQIYIDCLKEQFPACSRTYYKTINGQWNPRYRWFTNGVKAVEFLELIQPYLLIKSHQCSLALEHISLGPGRGKDFTPGVIRRRKEIYDEMRVLKIRGQESEQYKKEAAV